MSKPFKPEMPCPHCGQNLKLPADITDRFNRLEAKLEKLQGTCHPPCDGPEAAKCRVCDRVEKLEAALEYCCHDTECILSKWSQGEPIPGGGYRTMYDGKWYEKTPKCTCGLDDIFAAAKEN